MAATKAPPVSGLDIGGAVRALKDGKRVARAGWNGKGQWLALMPKMVIPGDMINTRTRSFVPGETELRVGGYIVIWTVDGTWQPGWLASQQDMLADDWMIVE